MDGKHEGGKPGRHCERVPAFSGAGQRQCQEPKDDEKEDARVRRMEQHVRQVIAGRPHAPQDIIEAKRQPGERNPLPRADRRGEHPPKLRRAQPPIVDVLQEVDVVVPVHEAVLQRRQEGSKGNEGYKQGDQPVDPAGSGSGDH